MTNFLEETLDNIERSGHTIYDVHWVGSFDGEYAISWEEFAEIADVEYNSGYGSAEVAGDLIVAFGDKTWLERHEYDGSECWRFYSPPTGSTPAKDVKPLRQVVSVYPDGKYADDAILWPSLEDLNG